MIELCQHDHNYLAICQHYRAIFDTPQVQGDEETWKAVRDSYEERVLWWKGSSYYFLIGVEECCSICSVGSL